MPTPRMGYYIDGERVPSVTQVLGVTAFTPSDALCSWAAKLAREGKEWRKERDRAGFVGTAIHDAIESYPNPPLDRTDLTEAELERVRAAWKAHGEWVARRRPKVLLQELQLVSRELRCGGTPDLVVRIDGVPYLTDHKSSKNLDPKALAQVAAYAFMVRELCSVEVAGAIIFHHPPPDAPAGKRYIADTGAPFRAVPVGPEVLWKTALEAFRSARQLYDAGTILKSALGGEAL